MKRTGITVLLSVVLLIGVVCGVYFMRQAAQLRVDGENTVAAAESTLAEAQARHDAVDPDTETGALKADNAALDESINAMEKEIETKLADEDTAYYNTVYEEMQKGVDQVEEYLKGN